MPTRCVAEVLAAAAAPGQPFLGDQLQTQPILDVRLVQAPHCLDARSERATQRGAAGATGGCDGAAVQAERARRRVEAAARQQVQGPAHPAPQGALAGGPPRLRERALRAAAGAVAGPAQGQAAPAHRRADPGARCHRRRAAGRRAPLHRAGLRARHMGQGAPAPPPREGRCSAATAAEHLAPAATAVRLPSERCGWQVSAAAPLREGPLLESALAGHLAEGAVAEVLGVQRLGVPGWLRLQVPRAPRAAPAASQ